MNRRTFRAQVSHAVVPLLDPNEKILYWGPVWIAEPRPRVPVFALKRSLLGMAVTDRRMFVVDQPRRRRAGSHDVVLATHHDTCRLLRYRSWGPMLQVRLQRNDGRSLVAEFRPRDRSIGHALAARLRPPAVRIGNEPLPRHELRASGVPDADISTEEVPIVTPLLDDPLLGKLVRHDAEGPPSRS